jgi:hypothetical protein
MIPLQSKILRLAELESRRVGSEVCRSIIYTFKDTTYFFILHSIYRYTNIVMPGVAVATPLSHAHLSFYARREHMHVILTNTTYADSHLLIPRSYDTYRLPPQTALRDL